MTKNTENVIKPHKATTDQWALIEKWAADCTYDSCLLDLRNRLDALEAKQRNAAEAVCPHVITSDEGTSYCGLAERMANSQSTPNDRQIRSSAQQELADFAAFGLAPADHFPDPTKMVSTGSLVERVADALTDAYVPAGTWGEEARAAIREVATYIRQHNPFFELDTPAESDVWGAVAELLDQEVNRD